MKEVLAIIIKAILGISITFAIAFGCDALIVWLVCKIVGWTFAWKWVVLFAVIYFVLSSLMEHAKNDK